MHKDLETLRGLRHLMLKCDRAMREATDIQRYVALSMTLDELAITFGRLEKATRPRCV